MRWCYKYRYVITLIGIGAFLTFARVIAWDGPGGGITQRLGSFW
jgi:hypothetical protein